jgi:hypothetical protein
MFTDNDVEAGSLAGAVCLTFPLAPGLSETDVEHAEVQIPAAIERGPGHFEVIAVSGFCRTKAGTVTADVKIGGTTCLASALALTAAAATQGTLSTTRANRRGKRGTNALTVHATTDGSGVLTDGFVLVWVRAYPAARE